MGTAKDVVFVSYQVFLLSDDEFAFLTTPSPTNGLVDRVDHRSAVVHTGIHTGVVELAVELRDQRPGSIDLSWDEVAETSLAPDSDVRIRSLMDDVPPTYPGWFTEAPVTTEYECTPAGETPTSTAPPSSPSSTTSSKYGPSKAKTTSSSRRRTVMARSFDISAGTR